MIYSDVKLLLEGYVEYSAFMHGIDFKLRWYKNLKQFNLLVKNPVRESVLNYLTLLEFEMGDIKNQCVIQITNFQDYNVFLDMMVQLDNRSYRYKYRDGSRFEIEVTVKEEEKIREVLDMLEKIGYFDRWR